MSSSDFDGNYRLVVFLDTSCGYRFLTRSCVETKETTYYEGYGELPLVRVEISSMSHPFYTGEKANFSNISTVDKFNRRYNIKR